MARKNKLPYHRLMVDVEPDVYDDLKAEAVANERSVSKQAKVYIKQGLEKVRHKLTKAS